MAFWEREFIEIRRNKAKMEIVGTLKCSVEREDVRKYIRSCMTKEKRTIAVCGILTVIAWLLAAVLPVSEFFLTNAPNQHLGAGTLVLTVVFALLAIICTIIFVKNISASKRRRTQADPSSAEQLLAAASDAVVWKQNRQRELCHAHDLVPLESALQGHPVFLGSHRPTNAATRSLRQFEEKKLVEYAVTLTRTRKKETASNTPLLIYFDIEKLGGGLYGLAAGQAIARVLSAEDLEGISISSGDSSDTLNGSANEYVIGLFGKDACLDRIERRLRAEETLTSLLSKTGISRTRYNEPLVEDGKIQDGAFVSPPGHSASFCAAGFKEGWKNRPGF